MDQRQFTSGEIGYLVRELGENNKIEDDLNKVLKLNQDVCVISDSYTSDLFKIDDNVTKNTLDQGENYEYYSPTVILFNLFLTRISNP